MLSVKNLDLYYGDAQALSDVSLEVPQGEIVAIVGANGAGKSSLIRTIAGIEVARSGSIHYNSKNISSLESHEICNLGIGQVAQRAYVLENGRIVMSGPGPELLHNDRVRQAYLGL